MSSEDKGGWKPKVVGLDGIPHANNPPPDVSKAFIEHLEELAERARNGDIVGLAYVSADPLGNCCHYWVGSFSGPYTVTGALAALQVQFIHRAFDDN